MNLLSSFLNGANHVADTLTEIVRPLSAGVSSSSGEFDGEPLSLGDFYFSDWDSPESITHGVCQMITAHELIGGEQVFDVMGARYKPITFDGKLFGQGFEDRARRLKQMCIKGARLPLAWGPWDYNVLIEDADFRDRSGYTEYTVTCRVVERKPVETGGSLTSALGSDLTEASGLLGAGGLADTLTGARGLIGGIQQFADTASKFTSTVMSVKGQIDAQVTMASETIKNIRSGGGIANATDAIGALKSLSSASRSVANLSASAGFLGRAIGNAKRGTGF